MCVFKCIRIFEYTCLFMKEVNDFPTSRQKIIFRGSQFFFSEVCEAIRVVLWCWAFAYSKDTNVHLPGEVSVEEKQMGRSVSYDL